MLRLMRDKFKALKWILWLVIAAFVGLVFVGWGLGAGGMNPGDGPAVGAGALAEVDGRIISRNDYRRQLDNLRQRYRSQFGEQAEMFLQQLGPKVILDQLVTREVALHEARRTGLSITDDELRAYIVKTFVDENGEFIGRDQLDRISRLGRGLSPKEFRESVAEDLLNEKLADVIRASALATDAELKQEYLSQNDKAEVEYVYLEAAELAKDVSLTSTELTEFYQANPSKFESTERKARYVVFSASEHAANLTIEDDELRTIFNERSARGDYGEERRSASHILLKTEPNADPETVRATEERAKELLVAAQGGADFARLAAEQSEDEGSASRGGDLGAFGRGAMVPAFEQAVFAMKVGDIIGPVQTQYGYHVIRLDRVVAADPTFESMRDELRSELTAERSLDAARTAASDALTQHAADGDLAAIARAAGVDPVESPFMRRAAPPAQLTGVEPAYRSTFAWTLFNLKQVGDVVERPLSTSTGAVVIQYAEERGPILPPLEDIRADVERAARTASAQQQALVKASEIEKALASGMTLADAAASLNAEAKTATVYRKAGVLPGVPGSETAAEAAYQLEVGSTSGPVELDTGVVFVHPLSRFDFDPQQFDQAKGQLAETIELRRSNETMTSLLAGIRRGMEQRGDIRYHPAPELSESTDPVF